MKNSDVTIYFNPSCHYCHMALEFFASELPNVRLTKVQLDGIENENKRKFVKALGQCGCESRGIPLIIIGVRCLQGFDDAVAAEIIRAFKKPQSE